jgi:hypothetical protein
MKHIMKKSNIFPRSLIISYNVFILKSMDELKSVYNIGTICFLMRSYCDMPLTAIVISILKCRDTSTCRLDKTRDI